MVSGTAREHEPVTVEQTQPLLQAMTAEEYDDYRQDLTDRTLAAPK